MPRGVVLPGVGRVLALLHRPVVILAHVLLARGGRALLVHAHAAHAAHAAHVAHVAHVAPVAHVGKLARGRAPGGCARRDKLMGRVVGHVLAHAHLLVTTVEPTATSAVEIAAHAAVVVLLLLVVALHITLPKTDTEREREREREIM